MNVLPEREIFRKSCRYEICQILNWSEGPPPKFIACHSLTSNADFIAAQRMGTWAEVDIYEVSERLNGLPATHSHVKSGHMVREIGRGWAQVSVHPIEEMTCVSVYEHDGKLWVRNAVEFDDGRFEPLAIGAKT